MILKRTIIFSKNKKNGDNLAYKWHILDANANTYPKRHPPKFIFQGAVRV